MRTTRSVGCNNTSCLLLLFFNLICCTTTAFESTAVESMTCWCINHTSCMGENEVKVLAESYTLRFDRSSKKYQSKSVTPATNDLTGVAIATGDICHLSQGSFIPVPSYYLFLHMYILF